MSTKIPFTILFENQNIDFFFKGHSETKNANDVSHIASQILDLIDRQ